MSKELEELYARGNDEQFQRRYLELVSPSLSLSDYRFLLQVRPQSGSEAHDEFSALQPFIATMHQEDDCGLELETGEWNEVARLTGMILDPEAVIGRILEPDDLWAVFDSVDSNMFAMHKALDENSALDPCEAIAKRLGDCECGPSMFLQELTSHPRWRGTKAASPLLAYSLKRFRGGAKWAVLRAVPLETESTTEVALTATEMAKGSARLTKHYKKFGFVKIPRERLINHRPAHQGSGFLGTTLRPLVSIGISAAFRP